MDITKVFNVFLGHKNEERDTIAKTIKRIRELNKAGTYGEYSDIAELLCRRIAEAYSCKEGLEFELITRLPFSRRSSRKTKCHSRF